MFDNCKIPEYLLLLPFQTTGIRVKQTERNQGKRQEIARGKQVFWMGIEQETSNSIESISIQQCIKTKRTHRMNPHSRA